MVPTTGAIPSGPDYRDGVAASVASPIAAATALPAIFQTKIDQLKVLDQNQIPSCVSHAFAVVMMYWWWKTHNEIVEFSPRFLDILSSQPWIALDGGRVPRDVCKVAAQYGCATVKTLPNDTVTFTIGQYRNKASISPAAYAEALTYRIPGYVRISDATVNDFRNGIQKFDLVSGLFEISDALWTPSYSPADIDPLRAKTATSGHQMVVYGWNGVLNMLRNSWGTQWNRGGNGTYNPAIWQDYTIEGWAIASIPADSQTLLAQLPKPEDFHYQWNRNLAAGNTAPDDDVKFAQIALMILGLLAPVSPDQLGYFGPRTSKGVLAYQTLKKIPIASRNGNAIGPLTRGFLNKDFAL